MAFRTCLKDGLRTLLDLEEKLNEIAQQDEFLDSFISRFTVVGHVLLSGEFPKACDKQK